MNSEDKIYACDCGKEYSSGAALRNHKRVCPTYHMNMYGTLDKLNDTIRKRENSKIAYKQHKLQEWISEKHTCMRCGKVMVEYFGSGRYCSRYCANAKPHSIESKQKVSESLKRKFIETQQELGIPIVHKHCSICGCSVRKNNTSGYCLNCIRTSPKLTEYRSNIGKHASSFSKTKSPWKSRNIMPYSEIFWKQVLDNNQINYNHNYTIHIDSKHWYYADFYIEKDDICIDLEIDGKQHKYPDRKEHDINRDEYLTANGYIVYRIEWNELTTDVGKSLMKSKIQKFLEFYQRL